MRLIRIPAGKDVDRWINADHVSSIILYPYPEDTACMEMSIQMSSEDYIELRYRSIGDARQLIADIAGKPLEEMRELLS